MLCFFCFFFLKWCFVPIWLKNLKRHFSALGIPRKVIMPFSHPQQRHKPAHWNTEVIWWLSARPCFQKGLYKTIKHCKQHLLATEDHYCLFWPCSLYKKLFRNWNRIWEESKREQKAVVKASKSSCIAQCDFTVT